MLLVVEELVVSPIVKAWVVAVAVIGVVSVQLVVRFDRATVVLEDFIGVLEVLSFVVFA